MSELKTTSLSHKDNNTGTPNITMYPDGSTSLPGTMLGGFRNQIINGGMAFWQRGLSGAGTGYKGPDRWRSASTTPTVTRRTIPAAAGQAGVPTTYSCGVAGSGGAAGITQSIELPNGAGRQNGYDIGNTYTFSWYANVTSTSNLSSYSPAFVDDSDGTNLVTAGTQTAIELIETLGTSGWGRFKTVITITGSVAGSNQALRVGIATLDGSEIQFTGLQLEPGPVATPFEHRPIGTELALCQRYYQTMGDIYLSPIKSDNTIGASFSRTVDMRTTPTESADFSKVTGGVMNGTSQKWNLSGASYNGGNTASVRNPTADAEL